MLAFNGTGLMKTWVYWCN